MTALHWRYQDGVSLEIAINAAAIHDGVAMLATPRHYHVAAVDGVNITLPGQGSGQEQMVDLDEVFDARVFTATAELRWLHESDGQGRAVMLAEQTALLPVGFDKAGVLTAEDTLDATYLLWGNAVPSDRPGWTALATSRIGVRWVPSPGVPVGHRVRLTAVEYIVTDKRDGNAYVAEERLTGLVAYQYEGSP